MLSRTISRHHWIAVRSIRNNPKFSSIIRFIWNHIARPEVIIRAAIAPVRGQGLGSTMWYVCAWWVITCFLEGIGLLGAQIHMLGL